MAREISIRGEDEFDVLTVAEAALRDVPNALPDIVCVGDTIDTDMQEGFLRGHGTQVIHNKLIATVCGLVERVNKLVSVRPLQQRYSAALGDIVIGRVAEVAGKRWKIDLNARQDVALQLSSVDLPGGAQRRRTAEDEINMRSIFQEGDLISAEVQSLHADGSIALHTRSAKYGKLSGGQAVTVSPNLIKRQKQHFNVLANLGVEIILGCNGMIWVAPQAESSKNGHAASSMPNRTITPQQRSAVCRVANAVRILALLNMLIFPSSILNVCKVSSEAGTDAAKMLQSEFISSFLQDEVQRRLQESL
ncbi:hypothetical protein WJX75_004740 [Coccomyxa subellipsoidea]|uniref:Ribosomal RNA-processing protein 4 n=1 Tax=Coccomyxa subellipsoidea TaxID=248742 RepID=A0ABR2YQP0_9CHLO